MDFFKGVWSWFSGSSISASLAKTALLGYVSRLLSGSTNPGNTGGGTQPDPGVRLQLNPSTDNQIPVLYGEAYFGGNITDAVLSTDYKKMTYCLTLAEKTGTKFSSGLATAYTFNGVYLNNNRVVFKADGLTVDYTVDASGNQDTSFRDLVKIYFYAGSGIQPQGSSGTTPASYSVMPGWNSTDYPMTGLIYAIIEVNYNKDKGVTGLPECLFHVTSNMTLPGDVIYDYITSSVYGAGVSSSEVNTTSLTAVNSYATTGFTYTDKNGSSATGQIKINGLVDVTQPVLDNLNEMAKAASSWLNYDIYTGKWNVIINQAGTSVAAFTDSNIIGDISISGTSLLQLGNSSNVQYQNTDILDKTDFIKIEIPAEDRYQNEIDYGIDISLPFTNNQVVAAKIGLQALKQARVDKIITFKSDFSYINITAGSLISVTSSVYGFTNKLFRVITATETYAEDGIIEVEFKALEYDADVYTYNITEYDITTDAGIIAIGSIGKPNTPTVAKTEQANVPKIIITAQVPSGIVDAVEFWITFDTGIATDSARTYIKIGTFASTNGSALTEDEYVSYTYSGLQQSDFYVKVRGANNVTVGPYSDPSGLITYVPVVVADTVSDSPVSVGGSLMGLGLLTLLNNLDKLFKGDSAVGGLFDKMFSVFKDVTGVDLVGEASGGSLVVEADFTVKADGEEVSAGVSSIDFEGPIVAEGDGDVTVKLKDGTANKDILAWDAENSQWRTISGCIDCDFPVLPEPPTPAVPCSLQIQQTLPANNYGSTAGLCPTTSTVPYTGSYFIKFRIDPGAAEGGTANPSIPLVAPLVKGTGSFKLYGTDGNLEQTLAIGSCIVHNDVIELPFSNRAPGKDYYIIWDEGVVTSCSCENAAINNATTWTFTTSQSPRTAYQLTAISPTEIPTDGETDDRTVRTDVGFTQTPSSGICSAGQKLVLTFSQKIKKGTGTIVIKERETGATVASFPVGAATITQVSPNWKADFGTIPTLEVGKYYDVYSPRGILLTDVPASESVVCDKTTQVAALPDRKSVEKSWGLKTDVALEVVNVEFCKSATGNATLDSNIKITFNKSIRVKDTGPAEVTINGGTLFGSFQKIDLKGTYENKKYGSLYSVDGTTLTINPTQVFKSNTEYHMTIPAGVIIDDECDEAWAGVSDSTTIAWKTDGAAPTPPQGLTYGSVLMRMEYDRPILPGYAKITIRTPDGKLKTQISARDIAVKIKYNERF